jgi:hypothetical protein
VTEQIAKEHFLEAFMALIVETFESGRAGYLDRGTSIFETLATITAEEASRTVSADCATIAAHVAHMTVALSFSVHLFRGERLQVNWGEIWQTVREVTDEEWRTSQASMRENYAAFCEVAKTTHWESAHVIEGALEVIAHNAYHLGEIRHALCTLRPER